MSASTLPVSGSREVHSHRDDQTSFTPSSPLDSFTIGDWVQLVVATFSRSEFASTLLHFSETNQTF